MRLLIDTNHHIGNHSSARALRTSQPADGCMKQVLSVVDVAGQDKQTFLDAIQDFNFKDLEDIDIKR